MRNKSNQHKLASCLIVLGGLILLSLSIGKSVQAHQAAAPSKQASNIHPQFPLLDKDGNNVLTSGEPISTMKTCGSCHDTEFIANHSEHADAGLSNLVETGTAPAGRAWDFGTGLFGRWNPFLYRYLSPTGDKQLDLSTPEWVMEFGSLHTGGGPAETSRDGRPLTELLNTPMDPETSYLDPQSGQVVTWDWNSSGTIEMNCFLCHLVNPNNQERIAAIQKGDFSWANSATLLGTGLVKYAPGGYKYAPENFTEEGLVKQELMQIQDPTNGNCGQCHGIVHENVNEPVVIAGCESDTWRTRTSGQVISPQRLSDSGMNLENKDSLARPFDIHAERGLECTDCHFSINNPIYSQGKEQPAYLTFDPRRLEIGEYLEKPNHQFARGSNPATFAITAEDGAPIDTMRGCDSCHSIEATHDWLPYKDRHMNAVSCETCHIPHIYSNAYETQDWTVLKLDSTPSIDCKGLAESEGKQVTGLNTLVSGFTPALLEQQDADGNVKTAPFNLVTSYYWIYGDPPRPVRLIDLQSAWFQGEHYAPEILSAFDANLDGELDNNELVLDNEVKYELILNRLEMAGVENPRITGEIQAFPINHDIAAGEWATRDCQTCHSQDSIFTHSVELSSFTPAGIMPEFINNPKIFINGTIEQTDSGKVVYQPTLSESGLYLLGKNSVPLVDKLGGLLFLGVLAGIFIHGSLRLIISLRQPKNVSSLKRVYMYSLYERFWHWMQTFVIIGLLFTGLVIHKPDTFGFLSFRGVVLIHNILALILGLNAALSLFYHLASGEIRQYIPRPAGFFDQAIQQTVYYLKGIFKREPHPFEKTPERKLNPLQQATYFGLLNVLLPLIGLSGLLMWSAQRFPVLTAKLGGLPLLAPTHTMLAWLMGSFIVLHVYLTTTGPTPLGAIEAMMMGWDEVEIHSQEESFGLDNQEKINLGEDDAPNIQNKLEEPV